MTELNTPLLDIQNLTVGFANAEQNVTVVDEVNIRVYPGEVVGIAGESGCGKSATAFSVGRLLPWPQGKIMGGHILFEGKALDKLSSKSLQAIRGKDIGFIFQEPMTALNPVIRIGYQITEVIILHTKLTYKAAYAYALELLERVGIASPQTCMQAFAHELSGGIRQRVIIAIALACKPKLIIADEPTTALDVTTQAEVLGLLKQLQKELQMALILISHDLGVLSTICQRLYIMYAGQIVESGPTLEILSKPRHPYTQGLVQCSTHKQVITKMFLPTIAGYPPAPNNWPAGCRFAPRCSYVQNMCKAQSINMQTISPDRATRCLRWNALATSSKNV